MAGTDSLIAILTDLAKDVAKLPLTPISTAASTALTAGKSWQFWLGVGLLGAFFGVPSPAASAPEDGSTDPAPGTDTEVPISQATGPFGVDVSSPVTSSEWACLKDSKQAAYGIVRCYRSVDAVDENCRSTVVAGWEAGLDRMDVYHFPAIGKTSAADQVGDVFDSLAADDKAKIGVYWMDVEMYDGNPSRWDLDNQNVNVKWLEDAVAAAWDRIGSDEQFKGAMVGIYTDRTSWTDLTGDADVNAIWTEASLPLWWARYDYDPASVSDFDSNKFGKWDEPEIKQYSPNDSACATNYDSNWVVGTSGVDTEAQ